MRLARACLLLAVARAFTPKAARTTRLRAPVPSVARRTTILRAEAEEANVGTAVRNIAPWLLFVLVGTTPRSNQFFAPPSTPSSCHSAHRSTPHRAGAAHPELQGVRRREGPRGLREPAALLPVALRARFGRRSHLRWLRRPWSACASTSQGRSTATRLSLCGIATPSQRCSYGSTSRQLVRRPQI